MPSRGKSWAPSPLGARKVRSSPSQSLRAVDGHAFARHQLGERVDLPLDALGPFAIDVDQTPSACWRD